MEDRVRDALTLDVVHPPGTWYEYAQSAASLLAEATARAVDGDFEAFAQRELMDHLGIERGTWHWERDRAGHVAGFYGVNMRPDDFGRLGELMRRGGVWRGHRLLSEEFMRRAIEPSPTNGCYGWLIWLNRGSPCVGPTLQDRPVDPNRDMPDLPVDLYRFSGLFGQLVTVFPSQGIVVVRTGQDPGLVPAGETNWEHETYRRVLSSVLDQKVEAPPPATGPEEPEHDYGFQTAIQHPDEYGKGLVIFQDPLPPPGPLRARAAIPLQDETRAGRTGNVAIKLLCPGNWPGRSGRTCRGIARLGSATGALGYDIAAGRAQTVRFTLKSSALRKLRRTRRTVLSVSTANEAAGGATPGKVAVVVRAPR
jgi:hypothetical protein